MREVIIAAAALLALSTPSFAYCLGTGSLRRCYDDSGNSYTVNHLGNSTYVNGYNSNTGSSWSQNSTTFGNSTVTNGVTNGRPWNETETTNGGFTTYSGTDSNGGNFYQTCTAYGCF